MKLDILFEDDSLLVINKPAGLVSTPADTTSGVKTLADILNSDYGITLDRGGLVHRLDKDTSGVIIAAKTQEAFDKMQAQFKERSTKKEYLALVHGEVKEEGVVEGAIGRNPNNREKFSVLEGGREAVTRFEPIKQLIMTEDIISQLFPNLTKPQTRKLTSIHYPLFTLMSCYPETGRTHQIRVHLKHISHPIVSDEKYTGRKVVRLDKRWCSRMFLHAKKISYSHPLTSDKMEIEAPLPQDLQQALSNLA